MGGQNVSESFSYNLEAIKEKLEKNELAQSTGSGIPILQATYNTDKSNIYIYNKQTTLDIYSPKQEINNHINNLQDLNQLRTLMNRGKMVFTVSQTKIVRISKAKT
jgi:hypothetical protein